MKNNSINSESLSLTTDTFVFAGTIVTASTGLTVIAGGADITGNTIVDGGSVDISTDVATNAVNIGTAGARAVTIGSTTALATTTIRAPSAGMVLTGVQGVVVSNRNYVTINTSTGAIGSDSAPLTSISITGNTGGALTGSSFTFTGGTTGLSFGGSGTTETLTFAGITANGGTVSLATDATTSTINIGTGAGVKTTTLGSTNTTSATTVQSGSGALNITSTNGALTIDSGAGALAISNDAANTTVTLATGAGVKTTTVGSTNTTSVTTIACGTGGCNVGTSANAHATVVGSTTASATTTIQAPSAGVILTGVQGVAVANKNYVTINTATGAIGSDAGASSSISITGDTGGALTGSSFTFTGGTTGLSFGGSGSTETLTFAGITANGGTVSLATDATTSTVNVGTGAGAKTVTLGSTNGASVTAIKYGTADYTLASATGTVMSALDTGEITFPLQSAFLATNGTGQTDVTGDGTGYTVQYTTEVFDQNGDYDGTSVFTAPVTGRYSFKSTILLLGVLVANSESTMLLVTSNRNYLGQYFNPFVTAVSNAISTFADVALADMDAADTASVSIMVSGGTKVVDIQGFAPNVFFSG